MGRRLSRCLWRRFGAPPRIRSSGNRCGLWQRCSRSSSFGQIVSGRVQDRRARSMLFATAAVLGWTSLNQFPFAAPIYFSYTTPLAVAAGVAAADVAGCLRPRADTADGRAAAVICSADHEPRRHPFARPLSRADDTLTRSSDFPRAHLRVGAAEAGVYRRLMATSRHPIPWRPAHRRPRLSRSVFSRRPPELIRCALRLLLRIGP